MGKKNGTTWVAENQKGKGVQKVSFEQFLNGKALIGREKFDGNDNDRHLVSQYIEKLIGSNYELVRFNCEHFEVEPIQAATPIPTVATTHMVPTSPLHKLKGMALQEIGNFNSAWEGLATRS